MIMRSKLVCSVIFWLFFVAIIFVTLHDIYIYGTMATTLSTTTD